LVKRLTLDVLGAGEHGVLLEQTRDLLQTGLEPGFGPAELHRRTSGRAFCPLSLSGVPVTIV
jgi:hypothetical protein